jgi:hypothetical protein
VARFVAIGSSVCQPSPSHLNPGGREGLFKSPGTAAVPFI